MGTAFFIEGGKNFFSCVHGSKMATGEVMFLAAIAWVKRGEGGEEKKLNIKENTCLLLNKNCFFSHLIIVSTTQFDCKKRHSQKRPRRGGIEYKRPLFSYGYPFFCHRGGDLFSTLRGVHTPPPLSHVCLCAQSAKMQWKDAPWSTQKTPSKKWLCPCQTSSGRARTWEKGGGHTYPWGCGLGGGVTIHKGFKKFVRF